MRIELDKLEELGGKFRQAYEVNGLRLGERDVRLWERLEVRGRVRRSGEEVELRGELHAKLEAACHRCLKAVVLPVEAEFVERFVTAVGWRAEAQHELREEDLNVAVFDGQALDLDDVVREEILLALPSQILCDEGCQGLCPICGIDRNVSTCQCATKEVDARWDGLKDLRI